MQSRWCWIVISSRIFPAGIYLLLLGLEKRLFIPVHGLFRTDILLLRYPSVTAFLLFLMVAYWETLAEIPGRIAVRTDLYGSGSKKCSPGINGTFQQNHKYSAFTMYFPDHSVKRRYSAFELFLCTAGEKCLKLYSAMYSCSCRIFLQFG